MTAFEVITVIVTVVETTGGMWQCGTQVLRKLAGHWLSEDVSKQYVPRYVEYIKDTHIRTLYIVQELCIHILIYNIIQYNVI